MHYTYCATLDWFPEELVTQMAPLWSMTFLFETVLPQLRAAGVGEDQIATMLEDDPGRWRAG